MATMAMMEKSVAAVFLSYLLLSVLIGACSFFWILCKLIRNGKNSVAMELLGKPYGSGGEDPADAANLLIECPMLYAIMWPVGLLEAIMRLFKD